jgi:hypothetical protein
MCDVLASALHSGGFLNLCDIWLPPPVTLRLHAQASFACKVTTQGMVLNLIWGSSRLTYRFQSSRSRAHCETSTNEANGMRIHSLSISNEDSATQAAASELDDKMKHLKQVLYEHIAMEGEAARLHQALLRQEQTDAMKLMNILQRNEEACAAALGEAMYTVERKLMERFYCKQQEMRELNSAQLQASRGRSWWH